MSRGGGCGLINKLGPSKKRPLGGTPNTCIGGTTSAKVHRFIFNTNVDTISDNIYRSVGMGLSMNNFEMSRIVLMLIISSLISKIKYIHYSCDTLDTWRIPFGTS